MAASYSLFPVTITEWNDLDYSLSNAPSINVFMRYIFKFIRFGLNEFLKIYNAHGLKLLTRLYLDLDHLQGHESKNFLDEISTCGKHIKSRKSTNLIS